MLAAEAVIAMHLRDAPHALLAGQHILSTSAMPEARFHAAVGIKRASMVRWAALRQDEVRPGAGATALCSTLILSSTALLHYSHPFTCKVVSED